LVSLFTDISSQMVFPLIPLYLTSVLGVGAIAVGAIEGAAETTSSLIKVFSGYWSDKIKRRKPFVLVGYSLSTITKPLFALAATWNFILFIRIIERIGKGIRSAPRDAIVAESVDKNNSGKAYGFHRSMDGIGSMIGAILAFALLPVFGFEKLFLYAFLPGIVALIIILFVKEKRNSEIPAPTTMASGWKELPIEIKKYILIASLFSIGHFGYAFILLSSKQHGLADERSIMLYALFYFIYSLFSPLGGFLSDKYGKKSLLIVGYLLFAFITLIMMSTTDNYLSLSEFQLMVLIFGSYGICYAFIDGTQRAFVADMSPKHLKATALGAFHTTIGLVSLPGGIIAGWLWDNYGSNTTYWFGFITSVLAVLFLWNMIKNEPLQSDYK
jgi:MFS family permease